MAGRRRRFALPALLIALGLTTSACSIDQGPPPIPKIRINVAGENASIDQGTTFGQLIHSMGLKARNGRLLGVSGDILERNVEPGQILLNTQTAPRLTKLHRGDEITIEDGADRTEGVKHIIRPVKQPMVANPEFQLGTAKMKQVTTEGRVSDEVLSVTYRPASPFTRPKAVALTFDDGPWAGSTNAILNILHKNKVPATFFTVGYLVDRYPDVVAREKAFGMTIGNHSWDHPLDPPLVDLKQSKIESEMSMPADALASAGVQTTLFRSPGGSWDANVQETARRQGMRLVMWSVDPRDWEDHATAKSITKAVLSNVRPGSIVLLHDGGGDRSATVKALPDIIKGIRKKGLGFLAVGPAANAAESSGSNGKGSAKQGSGKQGHRKPKHGNG